MFRELIGLVLDWWRGKAPRKEFRPPQKKFTAKAKRTRRLPCLVFLATSRQERIARAGGNRELFPHFLHRGIVILRTKRILGLVPARSRGHLRRPYRPSWEPFACSFS